MKEIGEYTWLRQVVLNCCEHKYKFTSIRNEINTRGQFSKKQWDN